MSPEETVSPQEFPSADPAPGVMAAPPRAVRLVARQPPTEEERQAARKARQAAAAATPEAAPVQRAILERKLAGLHDAQDILRVLDSELVLQRNVRESGRDDKSRQAMRVLSIALLFGMLVAALAAMSWLQSRMAQTGFSRHRTEMKVEGRR